MARVVPVLGSAGFTDDITIKVDQVLSNFYLTQASQTDVYRGSVVSMPDIIRRYGNDPLVLERETRNVLDGYLSRHFDEVNLTINAILSGDSIDLQITAILRDGERSLDIHHAVNSKNSKIRSIIDLQNDGKPIAIVN